MASHRRPKQLGRTRVTIFGATAAATVALSSQTAQAEPGSTLEEVEQEVDRLYEEAEQATEEYNAAKDEEEELQQKVEDLQEATAEQQDEINELTSSLGSYAAAQYRNGGIDESLQLLLSSDPDDYLEEASTLDRVSDQYSETLDLIEQKKRSLEQQQEEAADALEELDQLREELGEQKQSVQEKLNEAQELLNQLTEEEQAQLEAEEAEESSSSASAAQSSTEAASSSYASAALSAAQSKLGSPYVWGATGPDSFDCSGLTSWAYSQAGISIPRTSQEQASAGTVVSRSELQPGDLVFFYDDLHHVGIYAGNGQIIHAPRTGEVVSYASIDSMPFQYGVRIG